MIYTDLWPLIQQDILNCLLADVFTGTRNGVAVEPGDVEASLNRKVQIAIGAGVDGKVGLGFLILPIERAWDENPSLPGGPLKLSIIVQWVENVVLNQGPRGTQIPLRVYTARTEKILKIYTPVGLTQSLVPASPVINEFTTDRDANLRIGQVEFTASEADDAPLARLNRPQITVSGDVTQLSDIRFKINSGAATVTVTQAASAKIYYTLDGSHPYDRNSQAKLYSGPVAVTAPGLFRARAFGADKDDTTIASDTAAKNFT
jgi:hypothetical protein